MTSIKEQIETHRAAGYGTEELWRLFDEGKLVPADDSLGLALALGTSLKNYRVSEAMAAERERCARIAEDRYRPDIAAAIRDKNQS